MGAEYRNVPGADIGTDVSRMFRAKLMIWVFPRIGVPQNGWFIMETYGNPIKMDDLGGFPPIFGSTPIWMSCNLELEHFLSTTGLLRKFIRGPCIIIHL